MHKTRPRYLDLFRIRLPIPAVTSILHRASGILLFLGLPFFIFLLQGSLTKESVFNTSRAILAHPLAKLVDLVFVWALLHHLFAGVRFLIADLHKGLELKTARFTAKIVLFLPPIFTLLVGVFLLW
ncbi:MAG: succinate dehydrogenase, cytochrome b556 subunit [Neisseriaceae bacterium]